MRLRLAAVALVTLGVSALALSAAQSPTVAPKLVPMPAQPPAAQDKPYPGTIELEVDATDVARGIFRVHEKVPVAAAGPVTLLFPSWLPGDHSPSGQIDKLAGLTITANGATIRWKRNPIEVSAFQVDAPKGAKTLDISFQFVSATADAQGPIVMDRSGLELEWNSVLLYPAGYYATRIMFTPKLTLPSGWTYASALGHGEASGPISFSATDLSTLVDSPLFAGRYARRVDLDPGGRSPVFLNLFADRPDQLKYTDEQMAKHKALITQADKLFGARHFDHYDFLLTLSDRLQGVGLEHHRSSENGVPGGYFDDWDNLTYERDLLPHEMTHSWNGKYRRPADLWIPDFNTPMRDSLLWVYEGQTQYWGQVLAARSGLFTREEALDSFALTLATYDMRAGRNWKPLIDTTNDPVSINRAPQAWRSYSREEDYYQEGQLIWLDADTLIREKSGGKKSLDDFAKLFFGQHDGEWAPATYAFDDVVKALNAVQPYDWAGFLHARIDQITPHAPLDGFARGGYRLSFVEEAGPYFKALEAERKYANLLFSIGLTVKAGGDIQEVLWDGPAFSAGLTNGTKIVAVNGEEYDADGLRRAITDAKSGAKPIELLVSAGGHFRTVQLDYHGGLRYPKLERVTGAEDRLGDIFKAK